MRNAIIVGLALMLPGAAQAQDWPVYGHDQGAARYSTLKQINTTNVAQLHTVWTYGVTPTGAKPNPRSEQVPVMVNGVLYSGDQGAVVALEPETGHVIWKYDMGKAEPAKKGITYWAGDKKSSARLMVGTSDGRLLAIDAKTGKLIADFGQNGAVDLKPGVADKFMDAAYHMSSPGSVYEDLIVTGAQTTEGAMTGPAGDVRAWNMRTGKLAWTFHTIPRDGEPGSETWPAGAWVDRPGTGVWGLMTVDEKRGTIFVGTSQPAPDYYGATRHGKDEFSASLVVLDAKTGKLRWFYQLTHHDLWDLDNASPPMLIDVVQKGKKIPVVVTINKTGMMFFFNRDTGKPIYDIVEKPVPKSDVPGEESWPTQPFPVKPAPLARLSITPDEIFKGEPTHEAFCKALVDKLGGIRNYGPYTPYSSQEYRVIFPGAQGGANYGGASFDPKLGYVFVNTIDVGGIGIMKKQADNSPVAYRRAYPEGLGAGLAGSRFWDGANSMPCQQPPWSFLTAVNANTGDIAWRVPLGSLKEMESAGIMHSGSFGGGGSIVTAGGLVFVGATMDNRFRAFDAKTGKEVWSFPMDSEGHSVPITYMGHDGKQYIVISTTGLNALALP